MVPSLLYFIRVVAKTSTLNSVSSATDPFLSASRVRGKQKLVTLFAEQVKSRGFAHPDETRKVSLPCTHYIPEGAVGGDGELSDGVDAEDEGGGVAEGEEADVLARHGEPVRPRHLERVHRVVRPELLHVDLRRRTE